MKYRIVLVSLVMAMIEPSLSFAAATGGVPDLTARVTTLETLVSSLQTLVATLQTNVTTLQTTNNDLRTALDAEISARKAADASLKSSLDTEIAARTKADSDVDRDLYALAYNLLQEGDARYFEDQRLEGLIKGKVYSGPSLATFLPNGDMTVLSTLNLPAGNYYLSAKVNVFNTDDNALWACYFYLNGSQVLDRGLTDTNSSILNYNISQANIQLQAALSLTSSARVDFQCNSGEPHSNVDDIKFQAIEVGPLLAQ